MAKKSKAKRSVFRDKKTGRFVSEKTYKRSKAHGGKRYTKQTFQRKRKKTTKISLRKEFQVNVKYEGVVSSNKVEIQISATGPGDSKREQIIEAIEAKIRNAMEQEEDEEEVKDPKGWKIRIVFWEKKGKQFHGNDARAWRILGSLFNLGEKEVR